MTVLLGVDKLDDANGLVMKLQTFDRMLKARPALRNRVVLIQAGHSTPDVSHLSPVRR